MGFKDADIVVRKEMFRSRVDAKGYDLRNATRVSCDTSITRIGAHRRNEYV
jgi:hypothetical protein